MDDYTPSTEEVRLVFVDGRWNTGAIDADMFDRWLTARDRAVAANAWDEGYNVGGHAASGDYSGIYGGNGQEPSNPYRITEEN